MTDTSSDFAAHVLGLLKNSGTTGHSGHGLNKPLNSKEKSGTIREVPLVPVKSDWSRPLRSSGTSFLAEKQSLTNPVTSVTTGTAILQGAADQPENGGAPAEWHAILADLEQQNCPDWLSPDRWNALLANSENFLSRWGSAAHSLGWTALDLFGVHPIAPAARFDVMGLMLLTQGGAVVALTADGATVRRTTGAALSYQRPTQTRAVLISKVQP